MDRDPTNADCTRDPVFLLQIGLRRWVEIPDGIATDGESFWVEDHDLVPDWVRPFVQDDYVETSAEFWRVAENSFVAETDHGWPFVYVEWRTESVFLTRAEAEGYAESRAYRWDHWRVYCVPCDGALARILNDH